MNNFWSRKINRKEKESKEKWIEMEERTDVISSKEGEKKISVPEGHFIQTPGILSGYIIPFLTRHRKWTVHILLLTLLVIYTLVGATVFIKIEAEPALDRIREIRKLKDRYLYQLWEISYKHTKNKFQFRQLFLKVFSEHHRLFCSEDVWNSEDKIESKWTFMRSVSYCASLYLTTGFGDRVPITRTGRVITIIYSFIGVPFLLYLLNDLAEMFEDFFKSLWILIRHVHFTGKLAGRTIFTQPPADSLRNYIWWLEVATISFGSIPDPKKKKETEANTAEKFLATESSYVFQMPFFLSLVMVSVYILGGAYVTRSIYDWTYVEGAYFVFIALLTIGFGDYYLTNEEYMIYMTIYQIIGMALMTVMLGTIQRQVSDIRRAIVKDKN